MQLPTLEPDWQGDLGRSVPPEEWLEIVPSITRPEDFKPKCCKLLTLNSRYYLGNGRRCSGRQPK